MMTRTKTDLNKQKPDTTTISLPKEIHTSSNLSTIFRNICDSPKDVRVKRKIDQVISCETLVKVRVGKKRS